MNRTAGGGSVLMELPLGDAAPDFNLEKAVCSHGFFMMAPNHWDPHSKTLERPLRLNPDDDETSLIVRVSHPPHSPHALQLRVLGTHDLYPQQQQSLLGQVQRMLRLTEEENRRINEFHKVHEESKERGFGRLFRSPTLFEDMVKCMLVCNCQWSRTLSMAQALCELQWEMQHLRSSPSTMKSKNGSISYEESEVKQFAPKTPAGKESKRKYGVRKCLKNLPKKYAEFSTEEESDTGTNSAEISECSQETRKPSPIFQSSGVKEDFIQKCDPWHTLANVDKAESGSAPNPQPLEGLDGYPCPIIGNFPSPGELASLDEKFLSKRCNLGYRAARIINLAREIVEGKLHLRELENASGTLRLTDYEKLAEKLRRINGFGPFTCANVLMCMGFYHVVPTDSETIRHLKQVHAKSSTNKTVLRDVEGIYGKHAPFQFLAYWSEVWHFYEEWFGNPSEMPRSNYKLITAANMKPKKNGGSKRVKLSSGNM